MTTMQSTPTLSRRAMLSQAGCGFGLLALAQLPLTLKLVRQERSLGLLAFAPMSFLRAFARGIGMTAAVLELPWRRRTIRAEP